MRRLEEMKTSTASEDKLNYDGLYRYLALSQKEKGLHVKQWQKKNVHRAINARSPW